MATYRLVQTNDSSTSTYRGNHEVEHVIATALSSGNFTADATYIVGPMAFAGRVKSAYFGLLENGADGTDPQNTEFDVQVNGTTIFSTLPKLDKTAGTGHKTTYDTGTGITNAVINNAANTFAAGDYLSIVFNITRTTPDTESAGPHGFVTVVPVVE